MGRFRALNEKSAFGLTYAFYSLGKLPGCEVRLDILT